MANRGTYKRLNVVTGNAKAGEAYFNGAGGCKSCHSPTGDLAHIGARYQPDQLQNRFIWPGRTAAAARDARKVTVTLPSGETIAGTFETSGRLRYLHLRFHGQLSFLAARHRQGASSKTIWPATAVSSRKYTDRGHA